MAAFIRYILGNQQTTDGAHKKDDDLPLLRLEKFYKTLDVEGTENWDNRRINAHAEKLFDSFMELDIHKGNYRSIRSRVVNCFKQSEDLNVKFFSLYSKFARQNKELNNYRYAIIDASIDMRYNI